MIKQFAVVMCHKLDKSYYKQMKFWHLYVQYMTTCDVENVKKHETFIGKQLKLNITWALLMSNANKVIMYAVGKIHRHRHTHTYMHRHTHTYMHTHMYTCTHTHTHTYTHTHIHTHTHAHKHTQLL